MADETHASTSPLADHRIGAASPARVHPKPVRPVAAAQAKPQPDAVETPPVPVRPVKRPLFGKRRKSLELDATRPGYVPRWINNEPGRIEYAKECGYEHIKDQKSKPITRVVDRRSGLIAYAMEIPKELFDAAFIEKQRSNDAIDEAIFREAVPGGYRGGDQGSGAPATQAQVFRGRQPTIAE
jgi:hypothetical protein